jgi:hypothetical protein
MTSLKDATLPGTISYNGYSFGAAGSTPPSYRLRGVPIYDEARRTVTHIAYTLEVETVLYADDENALGTQMRTLREQLSRPGRKLVLTDLGLGDSTIVRSGTHPDVIWGARPRVVSLEPIGGTLAWQLHWSCEFNVREAAAGSAASGQWLAFNYATRYDIDEQGFTTRVISGYVQIVQVREPLGDPLPRRTADEVRDQLRIVVPQNFRRVGSRWTESADKARIDFAITDEELRTDPFPPGIVDAALVYRVENEGEGFAHTRASLTGHLETAPGVAKHVAATRFFMIAQDKMRRLQSVLASIGPVLVVPRRISVSHHLFTRRTSFVVELRVVHCLSSLLAASGVWDEVPGTGYRQWRSSVERLWTNRGGAQLRSSASDAVIVDLVDNPVSQMQIGASAGGSGAISPSSPILGLLPVVAGQTSWLDYQVRLRAVRHENVSVHTLAREVQVSQSTSDGGQGLGPQFRSTSSRAGSVCERHGEPIQQIVFEGVAVRLASRPVVPVLRSVGGRPVCERKRVEELQPVAGYCGIGAYRLRWSVTYDVVGYVGRYDAPDNPILGGAAPARIDL